MTPEQMLHQTLRLRARQGVELTVAGTSMEPILHAGDTIFVKMQNFYSPGDILVYLYKNDGLLVHRLLKIERERYFCKGDNSFRLEDIDETQIIGAVEMPEDPHRTRKFIEASLDVARVFHRSGFDREKTMESEIYRQYKVNFL